MPETSHVIQCLINGDLVRIDGSVATSKSVLNYLREDRHLPGSKEGCAEGDCGACTVVLGELHNNALQMRAVNACIQFVPTLNGKALFTVEYLRQLAGKSSNDPAKNLHPVQQAMVDFHGSQCGFVHRASSCRYGAFILSTRSTARGRIARRFAAPCRAIYAVARDIALSLRRANA
jgi:xanthine dehydrogenase small subunit